MLITISFSSILEIISYIVQKEDKKTTHKSFAKNISKVQGSLLRGILEIAFLPHKAYVSIVAIIKTIYRTKISKKHLLQWTTAEEAESKASTDIFSYYKEMSINVISGIIGILILSIIDKSIINVVFYIISILWIITPGISYYISKEEIKKAKIKELQKDEIEYVLEIAKKTWEYFETYINSKNNYLPPDNYQEDRKGKIVNRTSSTNIGLGLISIISAYDLGFIDIQKAIEMIKNMLETIQRLAKWNGHLYNWYNTENLEPLIPKYISSVDSGNFVGYLYTIKQFLIEINLQNEKKQQINEQIDETQIQNLINIIDNLIEKTDFSKLYDYEKRLFSIGFNIEENKLTDSYYDLLASEARQASLVAIAKHDIPAKHWQNLSRTLTTMNGYKRTCIMVWNSI